MSDLKGRLALITGATRGIGRAIAKRYAQEGINLILIGRTVEALEKIDDELSGYDVNTTLVPLDLRQTSGIEEMAHSIASRFHHLDILVGNAGILGSLMPLTHLPSSVWDEVWQVNFFANWHLLKAFEPLLKKSIAGRAVFVTSGVTQNSHPFWGAYSLSKKALEEMVYLYASENTHENSIKVNLVDPGRVRTAMRAQAMPGEDPLSVPQPSEIMKIFVKLASSQMQESGKRFRAESFKNLPASKSINDFKV